MRVTFCAYDKPDNIGGPPVWMQRLLPVLAAAGHEVRCLFLLHWGGSGPTVEVLRSEGIPCEVVLAHETTGERIRWILARLAEHPPDVFVPNLVVAAYHAAAWVKRAGIATVGILHSDDAFYRGLADTFVVGSAAFRVSALVVVSRELERQVTARGAAGVEVVRIGYGVPVPGRVVERREGGLRIGYFGRLAQEQKRILEVAAALLRVVREVPGCSAVMYGDGPERGEVENLLGRDGGGLPVRLGGIVEGGRVQERMRECDVVVLLSDHEGLPIALMEAMACGCVPVCLRMRSGIPELVEDGVNGILVDDRGDAFVGAVRRLAEDRELWAVMSVAARETVEREHSFGAAAAEWGCFLERLAEAGGRQRRIREPRWFLLPPVHPALASADVRRVGPSRVVRVLRRARMAAGRIRRKLTGRKRA